VSDATTTGRTGEQRDHVLGSAERLVAVRGFERVRLRDVAKEAGVSIGSLQHHFETRDGLLRETFMWSATRRLDQWAADAAALDGDPWERLKAMLERVFEVDDFQMRSTVWIEFSAAAARDDDVREVMADLYERWRAPLRVTIREGVEAGIFEPLADIDEVVDILAAQIDGLEVAAIIAPAGMRTPRLRELVLATARMALGVREGDSGDH
jgi:AcrR family transcriptional regulator